MHLKEFNVAKTLAHYGSVNELALSLGISNRSAAKACYRGTINSALAQKLSRIVGISDFKNDDSISVPQIEQLFGIEQSKVRFYHSRKRIQSRSIVNGEPMFRYGDIKKFMEKL